MSDLLVRAGGLMAVVISLIHGYLGETKLFPKAAIQSRGAERMLHAVYHCGSTLTWLVFGVLLLLAPAMDPLARRTIVIASVIVYAAAAAGNAWASRGRHYGWALLTVVIGLSVAGAF
jgi:hypothetical protein